MARKDMIENHVHTFDTHKHIKYLIKSGFKETQAEGIVKSIVESRDYDFSKLATKGQINELRNELKLELNVVEERLEKNILKWIIPLLLAIMGMIVTLMLRMFAH